MAAPNLGSILAGVIEEITEVIAAIRDKGAKRFGRALVVAAGAVFGAYALVYAPPKKKSASLQAEVDRAKTMADYSGQYKDVLGRLAAEYAVLPEDKDRGQWLANSVRDSITSSGLVSEVYKPTNETEQNGLIHQVAAVQMTLRFGEFYDWMLKIENAKPLMYFKTLNVAKQPERLGFVTVTCDIATVIPKRRFQ